MGERKLEEEDEDRYLPGAKREKRIRRRRRWKETKGFGGLNANSNLGIDKKRGGRGGLFCFCFYVYTAPV